MLAAGSGAAPGCASTTRRWTVFEPTSSTPSRMIRQVIRRCRCRGSPDRLLPQPRTADLLQPALELCLAHRFDPVAGTGLADRPRKVVADSALGQEQPPGHLGHG